MAGGMEARSQVAARLLQVLPSVVREVEGVVEIESDFCESLRLYCASFDHVTVACPVRTEIGDVGLFRCRALESLPFADKIRILPLPNGYAPADFVRYYGSVAKRLRSEIRAADYLLFSPHGLIGDWPSVAVREAIRQQRSYVIDADVVYHEVARVEGRDKSFMRRLARDNILSPIAQRSYRHALANSSIALLQGQEVFDAFASFCPNPHKIHHIPITEADYIPIAQLENRLRQLAEGRPLRLCYVGRCIAMKGPFDWLKALHRVYASGIDMTAIWLGDGSLLPSVRRAADDLGLGQRVDFRGYVANRDEVLRVLRESDLFVFCHQTPESPRCLVEALVSGCPLVGYGGAYPRELVAQKGGGEFTAVGDWQGLADRIETLARDRPRIRQLAVEARASGSLYDRDTTMQHRIDLIKAHANSGRSTRTVQ